MRHDDRSLAERPAGYCAEAGAFVDGLREWKFWGTLTFRRRISDAHADAVFQRWARMVARYARAHVTVVWGFGYQGCGSPHFHVLLAFDASAVPVPVTPGTLHAFWAAAGAAAGDAEFHPFRRGMGAPWHLVDHHELGAGIACPRRARCRRRNRCRATSRPL